jgi:hypothetical protein
MKANNLRVDKDSAMMAPIYNKIRKAKSGGASYIQVIDSSLTPEQRNILEYDGFVVTKHKETNGKEELEYFHIRWME